MRPGGGRSRSCGVGLLVAAVASLAVSCSSHGTSAAPSVRPSSPKPSTSVTASSVESSSQRFEQARTALASVTNPGDQQDSGGEELVRDGVHAHPSLKAGVEYRLQVVCVGAGAVEVQTGPPRKSARQLACDGVPTSSRYQGGVSDLSLNIVRQGQSSGVIVYQIMRVGSA